MVIIMGALSESLAVLGVVSESLAFLGSRLGALGRQAHVAGLARLARPLVVIVVRAPAARAWRPRLGSALRQRARMPATCGHAIDVPLYRE